MGKQTDDEPFVNSDLIDSINWVVDDTILRDETFKVWEHDISKQEQMHLSELGRFCLCRYHGVPQLSVYGPAGHRGRDHTKGRGKMMDELINTLETEIALTNKHLEEDKARESDRILGQFFRGRVAVEQNNLEIFKRLMDIANRIK